MSLNFKSFVRVMDYVFLSVALIFFAAVGVLLVLNITGVFVSTIALSVLASISCMMMILTLAAFLYKGTESCSDCVDDCYKKDQEPQIPLGKNVLSDSYVQSMFPEERVNLREAIGKESDRSFTRAMSISPIRHKQKPIRVNKYGDWKKDFIRKERARDDDEKGSFLGPGKSIV